MDKQISCCLSRGRCQCRPSALLCTDAPLRSYQLPPRGAGAAIQPMRLKGIDERFHSPESPESELLLVSPGLGPAPVPIDGGAPFEAPGRGAPPVSPDAAPPPPPPPP